MKTLTIVRHAKSSWNTNHEDHDRPLNKRGVRDAPKLGLDPTRLVFAFRFGRFNGGKFDC